MAQQRLRIGMSSGKLQNPYWLCVSDNNCQEERGFQVRNSSDSKRKKRTDVRIVTGTVFVQPGLYVQINDSQQQQSPSNISNATIVLPASAPTLGDWGKANLNELSETPVLAQNTAMGVSDIAGGMGEVPTAVSDPLEALASPESTIPTS